MIAIHTPRLLVRDPVMDDLPGWHELMANPATMFYLQDLQTHSFEESQQNLQNAVAQAQSAHRTQVFFAVIEKTSEDFVGSMGYTVEEETPLGKLVGLGYFFRPAYHGKGYATEALQAVLRFAFEQDNVYRVSTGCNADNKASERVMQKCGMIKEAHFVQKVWHDGKLCDRAEYRLLRPEYQGNQ